MSKHPMHLSRDPSASGVALGWIACLLMLVGLTLGTNVAMADQSVATGKVKPETPRASAKPARPLSYEEQEAIIRRKEEMQERVAEEELKKAKRARERH